MKTMLATCRFCDAKAAIQIDERAPERFVNAILPLFVCETCQERNLRCRCEICLEDNELHTPTLKPN